jgi:hypothetical protein
VTQTSASAEEGQLRLAPSHQRAPPSARRAPPVVEEDDSTSSAEAQAPEATEPAPPRSNFQAQSQLARENGASALRTIRTTNVNRGRQAARQSRRTWDLEQEEAFIEYMRVCDGSYAAIKKYDQGEEGYDKLGDFTQVNLKDKARSMAIVMIK